MLTGAVKCRSTFHCVSCSNVHKIDSIYLTFESTLTFIFSYWDVQFVVYGCYYYGLTVIFLFDIQFVVYGCYYYGLTVIFLFAGVYKLGYTGIITSFKQCRRQPDSPK